MVKKIIFLACLVLTAGLLSALLEPAMIFSTDIRNDVRMLDKLEISIDRVFDQSVRVYVNAKQFSILKDMGFNIVDIPNEAKIYADYLEESTRYSDDPMLAYYSFAEYETFLQQTVQQYPNICQLVSAGTSVLGRNIWFLHISDNVNTEEAEPEVRLTSSIHGDEVVGYDLMIRLIQHLTTNYGTDPRVTAIVNNTDLWINPLTNPDGYVSHTRGNNNGVDLNRVFPDFTINEPDDTNGQEPENAAIMNFSNSHTSVYSLNFHGGAQVANYPWDSIYSLHPEDALFIYMSTAYASNNPDLYNSTEFEGGITNGAAWYVVHGSLQDYLNAYHDCKDITLEVSNEKWPQASELNAFWTNNKESLLQYIELAKLGLSGIVTDSNNQPLLAKISIEGKTDHFTDPQVGDYHKLLLPGTYNVLYSAYGYEPFMVNNITIPQNQSTPVIQNVVLQPLSSIVFNGRVLDQNGTGLGNATINLISEGVDLTIQTGNDGNFSLENIYAGAYVCKISIPGYVPFKKNITVSHSDQFFTFTMYSPFFQDGFEGGMSNWEAQTPWGVTSLSGNAVLTDSPTGTYGNNINKTCKLISSVNLTQSSDATLSFRIKHNLESNYDYLYLEVSTNNIQWNQLMSYTGNSDWKTVVISLSEYIGTTVYLRFRITSDESQTEDGVYLDDFMYDNRSGVVVGNDDLHLIKPIISCQNYPNPFRSGSGTQFSLKREKATRDGKIEIFNVKGQKVRELKVEGKDTMIQWNGRNSLNHSVSTGIYFYRYTDSQDKSHLKKMLIIR